MLWRARNKRKIFQMRIAVISFYFVRKSQLRWKIEFEQVRLLYHIQQYSLNEFNKCSSIPINTLNVTAIWIEKCLFFIFSLIIFVMDWLDQLSFDFYFKILLLICVQYFDIWFLFETCHHQFYLPTLQDSTLARIRFVYFVTHQR